MGDTAAMSSTQASHLQEGSMAASVFSDIGSTFSSVNAIKAQGSYMRSVASANASIANLRANQTLAAGDQAASRKNLETQAEAGAARAQGGASGVDVNSGSSAMTQTNIRTVGAMDEATIRNNAARAAWGYQTEAISDTYQGKFAELSASSKEEQTIATGGLSAISNPLSMYSQSALWQYRYGGKGTAGKTFPNLGGGGASGDPDSSSNFWGSDQDS